MATEAILPNLEVSSGNVESTVDTGAGSGSSGGLHDTGKDDGEYGPKSSREYTQWLKALKDSDPNNAKYARLSKDNHSRLFELNKIEQRGIDGVRETYGLLNSISIDGPDGEPITGMDAVTAMQDQIREIGQIDSLLASGDPRALDIFDESFNDGFAKLAPAILDRVRQYDQAAYENAILPHVYEMLATSPVASSYNAICDILREKPPEYLPKEAISGWHNDKMRRFVGEVSKMGNWLNGTEGKYNTLRQNPGQADGKGVVPRGTPDAKAAELDERETKFHYNSNIRPKTDAYATRRFMEEFRPYDKRLRLDQTAKQGLMDEFIKRISANAKKNSAYATTMDRYYKQKSPDPSAVLNSFKIEFDKHAKNVMDALVNERYKPFLNGRARIAPTANGNGNNGAPRGPISPGVQIVAVKPSMNDIDHKRTPLDWIHQRKYRLNNGKVVQVR